MSETRTDGVSGLGLLGVLFVGLKLTGYIDWSWWYVTLPFWGGLAFALAIFLFVVLGFCAAAVIDLCRGKKRSKSNVVRLRCYRS